ncbi:unnamed protein product, partial [Mesorhabditis spiculigera]
MLAAAFGRHSISRRDVYLFGYIILISALLVGPAESSGLRLCGSKLTKTLLAICRGQLCGGGFMMPMPAKRNAPGQTQRIDFLQAHAAIKRGGVATECCERRCSFSYLKSFCCDE